MPEPEQSQKEYALGHSDMELNRLHAQSEFFRPMTSALLEKAGAKAGMRIIDIGCGGGDVSALLSEFVGPTGEVIGIDLGGPAVRQAALRAQSLGLRNVRFLQGDEQTTLKLAAEAPIDAVFGRCVLLHQQAPATFVRTLAAAVRPGGLLIFQDPDYSLLLETSPPIPLVAQLRQWIMTGQGSINVPTDISLRTASIFRAAGLPLPNQCMTCPVISSHFERFAGAIVDLLRGFQPFLIKNNLATAEEIDIDTLAARMTDALNSNNAALQALCMADAWLRLPSP